MKTIDTRDLYTRLCELETLRDDAAEARQAIHDSDMDEKQPALDAASAAFGPDEQTELDELETLRDEIGEITFRHGEAMIPTSGFEAYAQELAEDIGAVDRNAAWPLTCIDWTEAAKELEQDYTLVSYQGEDYFIRA